MSLGLHHSENPDAPPPEYSVHVPNQQSSPSSQHSPANTMAGHYPDRALSLFSSSSGPQFAPPSAFGPTPLMQSQPTLGLLPYYDLHSPYSVGAATSRARRRFVGAVCWAIIVLVAGVLCIVGALKTLHVFKHGFFDTRRRFGAYLGYLIGT